MRADTNQGLPSLLRNPQTKPEKLARWLVWILVVGGLLVMSWDFYHAFADALRGKVEPRSWRTIFAEIYAIFTALTLALFFSKRPWRKWAQSLFYVMVGWQFLNTLTQPSVSRSVEWNIWAFLILSMISLAVFIAAGMPAEYLARWRVSRRPLVVAGAVLFALGLVSLGVMLEAEREARNQYWQQVQSR